MQCKCEAEAWPVARLGRCPRVRAGITHGGIALRRYSYVESSTTHGQTHGCYLNAHNPAVPRFSPIMLVCIVRRWVCLLSIIIISLYVITT